LDTLPSVICPYILYLPSLFHLAPPIGDVQGAGPKCQLADFI
jgi:hypothetical protein